MAWLFTPAGLWPPSQPAADRTGQSPLGVGVCGRARTESLTQGASNICQEYVRSIVSWIKVAPLLKKTGQFNHFASFKVRISVFENIFPNSVFCC